MSRRRKIFTAVRWTATAAVFRASLQLAQIAILARLLRPEDYGLMAMVTVVLSFANLFVDLGLNSAYVQKQEVTTEQRSSLFWANVAMSIGLTVLVIIASPLLAFLFGDERLTPILMLSATTFVVNALGQQIRMTAEKTLNFRPVALLEIASFFIGFLTAVFTALSGWGVYSLVVAGIATALVSTLLSWIFLSEGWHPLWRFCIKDVRPFLSFGSAIVCNNIINQINISIDLLIGGRLLTASQLGLYSVPRTFMLQFQFIVNPVITRIGFPLIAESQHNTPKVKTIFLKTLSMTASINAPIYIGVAFFAPEVVYFLLGSNWIESIIFLRILAIWAFLRSIGNPSGSLLFGMGRADLALKWNVAMLLILPPTLWAGSIYSTEGLAWSLLLFSIIMFVPGWYVLIRPLCKARLLEYVEATLKPALIAATAIFPGFCLAQQVEEAATRLVIGILTSGSLYIAFSYKLNKYWFNAMLELAGRR